MSATLHPIQSAPIQPPASALRWRDRRFWLLLLLSIAFHSTVIVVVKQPPVESGEAASKPAGPLNVRILPPPAAEIAVQPQPLEQPPQRMLTVPRRTPTRPALPEQPPEPPPPAPPVAVPPPPPPPPMSFEEMVAARRAQRAPTVSEHAEARAAAEQQLAGNRTDAILSRNLGTLKEGGTSGVFSIVNLGSRYATFQFNGWKHEERGRWRQTVEVDAGNGGDVQLAVVRRMIELIRDHYQGNFNWESNRLGRVVILSARPEDQAGLEAFMLREFFKDR